MTPKTKKIFKNTLGAAFIAIIFYFFGKIIYDNWDQIIHFDFQLDFTWFIISLAVMDGSVILWALLWRKLALDITKIKLSYKKSIYIQIFSWFAKYIPGNAGSTLSKIYLGDREGLSKRDLLVVSVYENVFQILAAFLVGTPLVLIYFADNFDNIYLYYALPLIAIAIGLSLTNKKIFKKLLNLFLKIIRRKKIEDEKYFLSTEKVWGYLGWFCLVASINSLSFYFLIKSLTPVDSNMILPLLGLYAFGGVIGTVAIFAPGGLGVKEGIILVLLKAYFPISVATVFSLLSRVWLLLADLVLLPLFFFLKFSLGKERRLSLSQTSPKHNPSPGHHQENDQSFKPQIPAKDNMHIESDNRQNNERNQHR